MALVRELLHFSSFQIFPSSITNIACHNMATKRIVGFLDLPRELRDQVYLHACGTQTYRLFKTKTITGENIPPKNLLLVSRQVTRECEHHTQKHAFLQIELVDKWPRQSFPSDDRVAVFGIPPAFAAIGAIDIFTASWWQASHMLCHASWISELLNRTPNVASITIHMTCIGTQTIREWAIALKKLELFCWKVTAERAVKISAYHYQDESSTNHKSQSRSCGVEYNLVKGELE